jgi:hypothetical protein
VRPESWTTLERTLAAIGEGQKFEARPASQLVQFGLANDSDDDLALSEHGERYYSARFIAHDGARATEALGGAFKGHPVSRGFCEAAWASGGTLPKEGALRLLKRLLKSGDEKAASRWLSLLDNSGLIERDGEQVHVLWNPGSLDDDVGEEAAQAHIISPDTPYQNILSLRAVLQGARDWLWWFEVHMPPKALEVLHREIAAGQLTEIRLLSGPAHVNRDLQGDFKRAREEWSRQRSIEAEWRVIDKKLSRDHHDRVLLSAAGAYNVPPINTILKGSTSEILPSKLGPEDFRSWWDMGEDLLGLQVS